MRRVAAALAVLLCAVALWAQVSPGQHGPLGPFQPGIIIDTTATDNPLLEDLIASWTVPTFTAATNVITAWANAGGSCGASCDLSATNSPTATGGATGLAVNLVAASAHDLSAADNTTLSIASNADFGVCAWIAPGDVTTVNVVGKSASEYQLAIDGTSHLTFTVADSSSGSSVATTTGTLTASLRTFVCGWYTSSDKKAHASIDAGTAADGSALTNGPADAANAFVVEGDQNGPVDSLVFYKGAIPGVSALYNSDKGVEAAVAGTSSLVCAWDLDESGASARASSAGTGGAACDLSATNAPPAVAGLVQTKDAYANPSLGAKLVSASSMRFVDEAVATPFFADGTDVTLCGWGNTTTVAAGVVFIAAGRESASNINLIRIGRSTASAYTSITGGNVTVIPPVVAGIAANAWAFVCVVGEDLGATYQATPYLNGAAGTAASQTASFTTTNLDDIYLGSLGAAAYWDGSIAVVSLWRRALSAAGISSLYASGAGRFYDYAWWLAVRDPVRWAFRTLFNPFQTLSRTPDFQPYAGA